MRVRGTLKKVQWFVMAAGASLRSVSTLGVRCAKRRESVKRVGSAAGVAAAAATATATATAIATAIATATADTLDPS